jgi:hypothetical protein
MDSTIIVATIGGAAAVAAAGVGLLKKKSGGTGGDVSARGVSATEANVAIGNNITQTYQGTAHNYYGMTSPGKGPLHGRVATKPSPPDILRAIEAVTVPYDRVQVAKNYVGLSASWPVTFSSLSQNEGDTWFAFFDYGDSGYSRFSVVAILDIGSHPKLRIAVPGQRAWIEGRIRSAEPYIVLDTSPKIWFE